MPLGLVLKTTAPHIEDAFVQVVCLLTADGFFDLLRRLTLKLALAGAPGGGSQGPASHTREFSGP